MANIAKHTRIKKILLILCLLLSIIFLSCALAFTIIYNKYKLDINKLTSINNGIIIYSASMEESSLSNTNRSVVDIDSLPNYVVKAFVDVEDKRFFEHNGYDLKRIIKAGFVNLSTKSKSQGASTISQQLIKNALLSNEKTYSRKLKEIILAIKLEKNFNKNEILEMYLNTIYFGSNAYGLENASNIYFNKSAKELTINEACCLAGLIKSPANYSPITNYENSLNRKNFVAKTLYAMNDISEEEYKKTIEEPIELANRKDFNQSYEEEAIYEACKLLNLTERELINRKYEIVTFKDNELQAKLAESNNDVIANTKKNYDTDNIDSLSIVVDNSGKVQAYYTNSRYNLHNLKRQPASTLKPLAVYLPCVIHNILTPSTLILDEKINYNGYSPNNADKKFHGYVSTREAVSNSYNIPAVKALDYVGINKAKDVLTSLGINISKSDNNLSLALGAVKNGVRIFDLLSAYSILANMGEYKGLCFVDKIMDENKNIIYKHEDYAERVIKSEDCFLVNDMLKETAKTGSARRLSSLSLPIASKTGTAYNGVNNTDLYNVAYTTNHTLLSWIGGIKNNTLPESMKSSYEPTEINKRILEALYENKKLEDFEQPSEIEKMPFDLVEYNENHIIMTPDENTKERYIVYDYFKKDNPPKPNDNKDELNLGVEISKIGSALTFKAKPNKSYKIYKNTTDGKSIFYECNEKSGEIELTDNNIFKYDEVNYMLDDGTNNYEVKIRPKDYLITLLNNQIISNKKKWYV